MLIATAPDLASIVNRRAVLLGRIAENVAQEIALNDEHVTWVEATHAALAARTADNLRKTAALAAKRLEVEQELKSIESGERAHSMVDTTNLDSVASSCGRKGVEVIDSTYNICFMLEVESPRNGQGHPMVDTKILILLRVHVVRKG
eukprot:CAMPEP_0201601042 /NCGR_PEP_ID=MMETSP0492-20130828/2065_1 /ASSEMBLY_ACC=CAM_ASM_000837 /TAXON_ID=420259 /ORGANISM="Thalassiosira gravida, Strain GMp14c1" /LENGTH=146 /DNA_ID=CAMNT_0048064103 /DNA_START=1 /DNA_END=439 /DNA_ORIENTATION=+